MKIVVAYSGGLDTSYTVMYLANQGHEVYAACADTGGFSPAQLQKNEENAYKLGAKAYATLDVKDEYYEKSLKYMVYGNVLRGGTLHHLLRLAAFRVIIYSRSVALSMGTAHQQNNGN